ncbi:MAG TPA: LCP family protein [Streptosporangiaceae bacterium]|nr:LCP family protein [Streptosporangiaceae bacterium]
MDPADPEDPGTREHGLPQENKRRFGRLLPGGWRPPGGKRPGPQPPGAHRSGSHPPGQHPPGAAPPGAHPPGEELTARAARTGTLLRPALTGRFPISSRLTGRRKALAWTSGIVATIAVIALLGVYLVYQHLNANLHQVDISGVLGSQPVDLHPQAENILVLGSDTRIGQGKGYGSSVVINTDHSDTLMIVHVAADRKWADIMSIPRDSWVNIPACKMGNGQLSSPNTFKINEAFTLGTLYGNNTDLGVACTVKTVEKDTGIRIDHFVAINFLGFRDMVNAVGGVPECNTTPINDPKSGLHLTAGHHVLDGRQALGYVRVRYTLGNGSDLERIGRQQAFMSSLVDRVKGKLLNPVAIYHFLDAATKSLTIDAQLGGITGLYNLAASVKNLPASQVTFFTLPTYPRYYVDPTDIANVMWTQPEDSLIFQAFRDDVPVSKALLKRQPPPRIAPATVSLSVLNGTASGGLQYSVASTLQQEGFKVVRTGDAASLTVNQTLIRYHSGQVLQARLLAAKVHGAALQEVPGTGAVTLVLGSNYGSTAHTGPGGPAPQPASSFAPRTASQNICT